MVRGFGARNGGGFTFFFMYLHIGVVVDSEVWFVLNGWRGEILVLSLGLHRIYHSRLRSKVWNAHAPL
jgi:hypothetical protein